MRREAERLTRPVLIVGGSSEYPDIEYISDFKTLDPVVLLCSREKRCLVVPQLEANRAARDSEKRGFKVWTPSSLKLRGKSRGKIAAWAAALLRKEKIKAVAIPTSFPHGVAVHLERSGVRVSVMKEAPFPARAVKTGAEIGWIRMSQQAAVIAMRAACTMLARASLSEAGSLVLEGSPLTSERVRRQIADRLLDHDCFCRDVLVSCGAETADPHGRGGGPLLGNEPIIMDIFPQHLENGYWGDLTRTVVRGRASKEVRKLYTAVKAAQGVALARVKPGVKCSSVHKAAAREFVRRGYETRMKDGRSVGFIHGTGHGVGLSIHEPPSLGLCETRLKKGHVITVEPGLYYPDIGGVRIEDTVEVTAHGWRYLAPCEKRLEL